MNAHTRQAIGTIDTDEALKAMLRLGSRVGFSMRGAAVEVALNRRGTVARTTIPVVLDFVQWAVPQWRFWGVKMTSLDGMHSCTAAMRGNAILFRHAGVEISQRVLLMLRRHVDAEGL